MQNLFEEVNSLDKRCYDEFDLSEDLLMEHAADGIADFIRKNFQKGLSVLIATGSGNNGADGITLARLLYKDYDVKLFFAKEPKSQMAKLQYNRIKKLGIKPISKMEQTDIVVDAILGTGFSGEFNIILREIMQKLNSLKGFKMACDVPSGLNKSGVCEKDTFIAEVTLTMGALKLGMFLDEAKEFVGEIKVLDLGVSREVYEIDSDYKLLDFSDMKLPFRTSKNTHKGSFGHSVVIAGEKIGAGVLCGLSSLRLGSGLTTVVTNTTQNIPYELMQSELLPKNTTAIAVGMGLGNSYSDEDLNRFLDNEIPKVLDADILYTKKIKSLLKQKNIILTPHPKEFVNLLKLLDLANISIDELQKNRFSYAKLFAKHYPDVVLVLKGANVIIAKDKNLYINDKGSSLLAKGGSGDVLAGLILSLLAQGYEPLEAATNGSLIHTKLASMYKGSDFSLSPVELIENIKKLEE
jgi:hydroxyethylthiazole kinase-like uncharacterized protein yjeF